MKKPLSLILILATLGPSLSLAYDSNTYMALARNTEATLTQLERRFEKLSPRKQKNLAYALYQIISASEQNVSTPEAADEISADLKEIVNLESVSNSQNIQKGNITETQKSYALQEKEQLISKLGGKGLQKSEFLKAAEAQGLGRIAAALIAIGGVLIFLGLLLFIPLIFYTAMSSLIFIGVGVTISIGFGFRIL